MNVSDKLKNKTNTNKTKHIITMRKSK